MKLTQSFFLCLFIAVFISSCKDDDDNASPSSGGATYTSGNVTLDFTNVVGTVNLDVSGATNYTNEAGNTFSVDVFKYYISNVTLIKSDSSEYLVPETYFLVDESDQASCKPVLNNVPGGEYIGVKYTIGVDSTRNVSGAQTGALDPANGMFWTWTTGYIFLKLEGNSSAAPFSSIDFHISGFKNSNNTNAIRNATMFFNGDKLIVNGTRPAEVHIVADVLKIFKGNTTIDFSSIYNVTNIGGNALLVADNYMNMFEFEHLHNN